MNYRMTSVLSIVSFVAILSASQTWNSQTPAIMQAQKLIVVDAVAFGPVLDAMADLQALGLESQDSFGSLISGTLPRGSLSAAQSLPSVNQIRHSMMLTAAGSVTSEGDAALQSNIARAEFDIDGSGVRVGVISDSYNCVGGEATDRLNDDLPSEVEVVEEATICAGMTDEGRALMHVIHDIARVPS